jgi:hypothetical protein
MDKHAKRLYVATLFLEIFGAVARFFVGIFIAFIFVNTYAKLEDEETGLWE